MKRRWYRGLEKEAGGAVDPRISENQRAQRGRERKRSERNTQNPCKGGLRGAVSLSLALLVDGNRLIGERAREMIFIQTTGIVTLTLILNGTTAGVVYKHLQVHARTPHAPFSLYSATTAKLSP